MRELLWYYRELNMCKRVCLVSLKLKEAQLSSA